MKLCFFLLLEIFVQFVRCSKLHSCENELCLLHLYVYWLMHPRNKRRRWTQPWQGGMVSQQCGMLLCADVQSRECHGDERLFPLKLFALCPKATGFDRGGVKSSVGQNEEGALSMGQLLQESEHSVTVDTFNLDLLCLYPAQYFFTLVQAKHFFFYLHLFSV